MLATAVKARDELWATPEGPADRQMPDPEVAAPTPTLKTRGTQLLGCGVSGHALLFAEHGFAVEAINDAAVEEVQRMAPALNGNVSFGYTY